ncbi:cAMP-dependent protein kinase regulatory subunit Cgs1 [Pleodorina starrii]|uniref:plant cystathionine gamma-synthase n=1 Tax=Pleodorina starrii TaxID=330485 RepID=A0A9W6BYN3_9CHLO|nr:cAMP-dependent protein kinase regulatory subunit Cgs1 [Pleodorina starrii]GLC60205.1 cAMP-dependent protein kinase regulatory subunit Cgs1 [Pleodorina starrii]GLC65966.1 cAMP-dependent protein kinase regulatory subunit Cgs1 [Pleodorina starrii]
MFGARGLCHVSAADMPAAVSMRAPIPASLRTAARSGLHLRQATFHRRRPSSIGVICNTAAKDLEATSVSGNGAARHHEVKPAKLSTTAVHGGERAGRPRVADALTTPIVQTSTYHFRNTAELIEYNEGRFESYEYGRYGNPTAQACEEKIKALEGAEDCLVSASGMNAVTSMLLSLVPSGGHIVTTSDCYWRTRQFMQNFLPKMNVGVSVIKPNDLDALQAALDQHNVTLFFSESPTNPYLRCVDIAAIARLCHAKGAAVCIDSTFATPINQQALALGADLVLHSATKYLAGHNDVLAGALCGKTELVAKVREFHHIMGGVVDPHAAYLLLRGLKTLDLRVERHNRSAMEIARRLEKHPKIDRVWYPGLESHPDHAIANRQMSGFGGVVSFEVRGGLHECISFIDNVKLPYIAPSLGGVESLIEMPAVQSYWGFGPERRAQIGIKENLVRFSIGIEDVEDIWADLEQALEYVP